MISRIKGTQDFLDLSLFNYIIESAKKQLQLYHFTEIATPILEPLELFRRSLGEYTDVVMKEMFIIQSKDDEEHICLRPEATASTVRAFIENGVQVTPWQVFSWGPMFRYERPQKGRYRQFHQITIEVLGAASITYDVQLIKMLDRYFHETLNLNNYALMINFLGLPADREKFKEALKKFLASGQAAGICELCKIRKEKNIMRIFDCKTASCQVIYQQAPVITDYLSAESAQRWQQLQDQLSLLSISFVHNPFLVRGLDYYNDTVFEFASKNLGAQNAFCAGGRYDGLAAQLGYDKPLPSLGASIGIERLLMLLEPMRASLPLPQQPPLHVVMPLAQQNQTVALFIADLLQAQNFCVDILLDGDSLKSMMRQANRMGAKYALLVGEEEQQTRTVTVKDMLSGAQERIPQTELVNYLKK